MVSCFGVTARTDRPSVLQSGGGGTTYVKRVGEGFVCFFALSLGMTISLGKALALKLNSRCATPELQGVLRFLGMVTIRTGERCMRTVVTWN